MVPPAISQMPIELDEEDDPPACACHAFGLETSRGVSSGTRPAMRLAFGSLRAVGRSSDMLALVALLYFVLYAVTTDKNYVQYSIQCLSILNSSLTTLQLLKQKVLTLLRYKLFEFGLLAPEDLLRSLRRVFGVVRGV